MFPLPVMSVKSPISFTSTRSLTKLHESGSSLPILRKAATALLISSNGPSLSSDTLLKRSRLTTVLNSLTFAKRSKSIHWTCSVGRQTSLTSFSGRERPGITARSSAVTKHPYVQGQDVYYSALSVGDRLYSVRLKLDVLPSGDNGGGSAVYKDHKLTEIEIAPALYGTVLEKTQGRTQEAGAISTVSLGVLRGNVKPSSYDGAQLSQERRGQIRIGSHGEGLVTLFKNADRSTFFHEMGHMMLDDLIADGLLEKANARTKADLDAVRAYLGIGDMDLSKLHTFDGAEKARYAEAQERFARSFEAYLMEGKSPTEKMRGVFARVRQWLIDIYHDLSRLNVELSPEVREVFDRLLATPDEIGQIPRVVQAQREAEFVRSASEVQERGDFGPIWRGYRGEAAIEKLLKEKSGEIPGAVSTAELGPVDFMYGEIGSPGKKYTDGWGISHIAHKHGIDAAKRVPQILRGGVFLPQPNGRVYYESPEGRVVVKLEWKNKAKTWVLTSFLPENEKDSRFGSRIGIAEHAGESSSSPDGNLSNARISQSSNESNRDFSVRSDLSNSDVRSAWGESSWDLVRPHAETRSGVESSGGYNTVSDGKDYYVDGRNGRRREITPDRYTERYTKSRVKRIGEAMRVLENASETPIRRGASAPKGVLGYFDGKKNAIHIKAYNDIRVATHEIGHAYDQHMRLRDGIADMVGGSVGDGETRRRGQAIYGELCELGKGTSPAGVVQAFERNDGSGEWVKARDYLMKEGIAEAFALNAVNRRLFEKSYPTYSAFFNERLDANPQYKASIEEAWNAIAAYEAQPQCASWAASITPL